MYRNDPVPDGPVQAAPVGYVSEDRQRVVLFEELTLAGVDLGDYDRRIVGWLAGLDWSTVATITSLIRRAGRCPHCALPHIMCRCTRSTT